MSISYGIPLFGVCAMTVGTLGCYGETFREKLDAFFAGHAQKIQESIQAWDKYNLHKPECLITEQELKDVVMRSYGKAVDWMALSMQHQIRFFDYYRAYLREGDAESLKKRFDCEQIRIRALRELGDMVDKFTAKGIYLRKLVTSYNQPLPYASLKLEEYKKIKKHVLYGISMRRSRRL